MNKKAIAILGAIFLLIIGTLGFLIYSKYGAKKVSTTPVVQSQGGRQNNEPGNGGNGNTPTTTPAGNVVKISDGQVVSPVLFYNGAGVTYFNNEGQLFQASLENSNGQLQLARKKLLDIPAKTGISKILWPAKGDDFIAEFKSADGKKNWSYYNSKTGAYVDLPTQVYSLDWMPDGDKIAYVWLDSSGKAFLDEANPDTTEWKKISDMYQSNYIISVSPDGTNILFYRASNSSAINPIYLTTPDGKVWRTLVSSGYNFGTLWSPDGKAFLFARKDDSTQQYQLWYYNFTTDEMKNTGLNTTVDKAVWSKDGQTVYAAVPTTGATSDGALTVDSFYKINTSDFSTKQYQIGSPSVDGRNLFLSQDELRLFFKNAQDGALYYLDLNQ